MALPAGGTMVLESYPRIMAGNSLQVATLNNTLLKHNKNKDVWEDSQTNPTTI